jgi:MFS superfamily sulfate permease-like transporter
VPAALVVVLGAGTLDAVFGGPAAGGTAAATTLSWPVLPSAGDAAAAFGLAVLPQLPLTLTNAVIVTAALARDLAPDRAARVTPRRLALSSGAANLLLAPLGALPVCHGAGGLAAQHRFGARTGVAPVLLGGTLLLLALLPPPTAMAVLAHVPGPVLGALLLVTAAELALSPRLFDARPSCRPVIAAAGLATMIWNPAVGLAVGIAAEFVRRRLVGDAARARSA